MCAQVVEDLAREGGLEYRVGAEEVEADVGGGEQVVYLISWDGRQEGQPLELLRFEGVGKRLPAAAISGDDDTCRNVRGHSSDRVNQRVEIVRDPDRAEVEEEALAVGDPESRPGSGSSCCVWRPRYSRAGEGHDRSSAMGSDVRLQSGRRYENEVCPFRCAPGYCLQAAVGGALRAKPPNGDGRFRPDVADLEDPRTPESASEERPERSERQWGRGDHDDVGSRECEGSQSR